MMMCFLRFHLATPGQMEIYHKGPFSGFLATGGRRKHGKSPRKNGKFMGKSTINGGLWWFIAGKFIELIGDLPIIIFNFQRVLVCSSLCFYGFCICLFPLNQTWGIPNSRHWIHMREIIILYDNPLNWVCAIARQRVTGVPSHFIGTYRNYGPCTSPTHGSLLWRKVPCPRRIPDGSRWQSLCTHSFKKSTTCHILSSISVSTRITVWQKSAMPTISSTCSQYPWHLATCAALRQWEGPGSPASPEI
jgi:hypothetical protein